MATGKRNRKKSVFDDDDFQEVTEQTATEMNKETKENEEVEVEFIENDNFPQDDADMVADDFNPLKGEVIRREYAQQVGVANVPEVDRVPEPSITNLPPPPPPPTGSSNDSPFIGGETPNNNTGSGSSPNSGAQTSNTPHQEPLNPDMAALSNKDAKMASTRLVDMILSGYKQFWGIGYHYIKVDDNKLIDWVMQNKISLDIKVDIGQGEETSLREVYEMFNSQAHEALNVNLQDEDFIKVREAMIREFTKRGWGVTDMQYILQHFVRDAGQRAVIVYQLKGTIDNFTKQMMKQHEEVQKLREELTNIKNSVPKSEPTTIPKAPKQQNSEDVVKDAKGFVETYTIRNEPEITEVPQYEGNEEFQSNIVPIDSDSN